MTENAPPPAERRVTRGLEERTFGISSEGTISLWGEYDAYLDAPVIKLTADDNNEQVTILLDEFHLRELRLAVGRAEKWLKEQSS